MLNIIDGNFDLSFGLVKYDEYKKKHYLMCKKMTDREIHDSIEYVSIIKIYNNNYYNYII